GWVRAGRWLRFPQPPRPLKKRPPAAAGCRGAQPPPLYQLPPLPPPPRNPPMPSFRTSRGRPLPLGTSATPDGANFALLCRHGTSVTLVILPEHGGNVPIAEFPLDPKTNPTADHSHVRVEGLPDTLCY